MIDFPRYLAAKKTIDDRSLNRWVWDSLMAALADHRRGKTLNILELGCGIGTMVERLLDWGLAIQVDYLGVDILPENIRMAGARLPLWAEEHGFQVKCDANLIELNNGELSWRVMFEVADITKCLAKPDHDLLIAHAFLDLLNVTKELPRLKDMLKPGGLFYFTINFDGQTIFEPVSDQARESKIIQLYHQSMDERILDGKHSGDSQTGRHLFNQLRTVDAQILAAGASDWVVYPGLEGYPGDEAYFLECILKFFEKSLSGRPELEAAVLDAWLKEKRGQIENRELTFIAHQLDFCGIF